MIKRGIMRHGILKTFLTRGIFKHIFKPLLYKNEDFIHSEFLHALLPLINRLDLNTDIGKIYAQWLVIYPREFFETLFVADTKNQYYLDAAKKSNLKNGAMCAHYTQAFVLWHLEQILKNDVDFMDTVGFCIYDIEDAVEAIYGSKNLVFEYLNSFRDRFDVDEMKIDPRDWYIIYVHEIFDLLISDEKTKSEALSSWDQDIFEKIEYIANSVQYFSQCKNRTDEFIA